jgi:hypothetical protein
MFGVRVAPAHEEPRSGLNNSEHESTSGRSTNHGSGHLIRVFRDIGRIFSLLFLLSHPSHVGHPLRKRVQKRKTEYGFVEGKNGFNCVSCGTHRGGRAERRVLRQNENPVRVPKKAGSREPSGKNADNRGLQLVNTWTPKMFPGACRRRLSFAKTRTPTGR